MIHESFIKVELRRRLLVCAGIDGPTTFLCGTQSRLIDASVIIRPTKGTNGVLQVFPRLDLGEGAEYTDAENDLGWGLRALLDNLRYEVLSGTVGNAIRGTEEVIP